MVNDPVENFNCISVNSDPIFYVFIILVCNRLNFLFFESFGKNNRFSHISFVSSDISYFLYGSARICTVLLPMCSEMAIGKISDISPNFICTLYFLQSLLLLKFVQRQLYRRTKYFLFPYKLMTNTSRNFLNFKLSLTNQ